MSSLKAVMLSSVTRKLINGITAVVLVGFVLGHMFGNLTFFAGPSAFNEYAFFMVSVGHGVGLILVEIVLLTFFLFHVITGIMIFLSKKNARPNNYHNVKDAGGNSKKSSSSMTMAITGTVLLVFLVVPIWQFKYGPGLAEGYVATREIGGDMRDLHRLVAETFQNPAWVIGYVSVMLLLFWHLRHGIWSMFQTLGANNRKFMPVIRVVGLALAIGIALGFIILPIYIYLAVDPAATAVLQGGMNP